MKEFAIKHPWMTMFIASDLIGLVKVFFCSRDYKRYLDTFNNLKEEQRSQLKTPGRFNTDGKEAKASEEESAVKEGEKA